MSAQLLERLRAKELSERLARLAYRARGIVTQDDWDTIEEAIRRLRQHEVLVEDILPELRAKTQPGWNGPSCCP